MSLPVQYYDRLLPHQVEPANWLFDQFTAGRVDAQVDLSDCGAGKTYVAAAVASALKLPTVIVCPKIARSIWATAAAHFGDSFSIIGYEMLRTGHTDFGRWACQPPPGYRSERTWVCVNCQQEVNSRTPPCYTHPAGIHCITERRRPWHYGDFTWHPAVRMVVFDEVHRCSGIDSLNASLLIAAKRQGKIILGLSATAACDPLKMRALGYALGFHTLLRNRDGSGLNFYDWAGRFGCRRIPCCGFKWAVSRERQIAGMNRIRESIIPARGVRVKTSDIPGYPERTITAELYDLDEGGEIDRLYAEMAAPLARLSERQQQDAAPECPLTIQLRARQKIELLKVPVAVELARDYVAKGHSVAIFVNFADTLAELRIRLECDCFIDGSPEGVRDRQEHIEAFQADRARVIVVNSKAGGVAVSLHDVRGEFPRVGLVFPDFSAEAMRQVFGRLHRAGGRSKCLYRVMFAADTVETKIHRNLSTKLNNLDALNDGDFMPDNLRLTAAG